MGDPRREPSSSGSTTSSTIGEREAFLEREELAADVIRMRQTMGIAVPLWISFFASDIALTRFAYPQPLTFFVVMRIIGVLLIGGEYVLLGRWPPRTKRASFANTCFVAFAVAALIGVMGSRLGGIANHYAAGCAFVLCLPIFFPRRFPEAVLCAGAAVVGYPVGIVACATLDPAFVTNASEPSARAIFGFHVLLHAGLGVFAAYASHAVWGMRRQVFESRSIGRYQLRKKLGEGGMGEVWSAYHVSLKRDVAVKILRRERADATAIARFEAEVAATTALTHPNTIRVFDYGVTDDGLWYYAMELLQGTSLLRVVRDAGTLDPARAVYFVTQAARAMAEAHRRGIVHRDIKPENLFVTRAGDEPDFVKVLDFGIAKRTTEDANLTLVGEVAGTPAFMAPEVAGGEAADARSDVYSLGAVLYFALTGRPPFEAQGAAATMLAHIREPVVAPSVRMELPLDRDVEDLVMRALAKAPEDRFADAGELARALSRCAIAHVSAKHRMSVTRERARSGERVRPTADSRPPETVIEKRVTRGDMKSDVRKK